jgi:hypothetical protein
VLHALELMFFSKTRALKKVNHRQRERQGERKGRESEGERQGELTESLDETGRELREFVLDEEASEEQGQSGESNEQRNQ